MFLGENIVITFILSTMFGGSKLEFNLGKIPKFLLIYLFILIMLLLFQTIIYLPNIIVLTGEFLFF